jgi:hypothetical protein
VLAAGDGTIAVVVAVVIDGVFDLPGVTTPAFKSVYDTCASISPADPVINLISSDVDAKMNIL